MSGNRGLRLLSPLASVMVAAALVVAAFPSVAESQETPTGILVGTVTDAGTGVPIGGASLEVVGPATESTSTDPAGNFSFFLPPGSYQITAGGFGFLSQTVTGVTVAEGTTTTQNFALNRAPSHPLSGHVLDEFVDPLSGATVTLLGTSIPPATTDATGFYNFSSVPEGAYEVLTDAGRCHSTQTLDLTVDGDETLDFALPVRSDVFGYVCRIVTPNYVEADTVLPLTGDDLATTVPLPFPFTFYGQTYDTAYVSTNGFLNFLSLSTSFNNVAIPTTSAPNAAVYAFWDDLFVDSAASVRSEVLGAAPDRRFVLEWRNVHFFGDTTRRVDFEAILFESGEILTQYQNVADNGREKGSSATLGIENESGTTAFQVSVDEPPIGDPNSSVLYFLDVDHDGIPDDQDVEALQDAIADLPASAFAPSTSVGGHRTAMLNRLEGIEDAIAAGDTDEAIRLLRDLRRKVDGCSTPSGTTLSQTTGWWTARHNSRSGADRHLDCEPRRLRGPGRGHRFLTRE